MGVRGMRSLWGRILRRGTEGISPWVGLALAALYLAAVVGVGMAALHFQRTELADQRLADAKRWSHWLGRHLAHLQSVGPDALAREVRQAAREPGVAFCEVISPEGLVVAHSDPKQVGKPAADVTYTEAGLDRVKIGTLTRQPGQTVLTARLASPFGGVTDHEVRVGIMPLLLPWTQSDFVFWAGYVLLAVLGLYLLVYHLLRRSIRPLAVIRDRLADCHEPIPERLLALRVNDSYDQISSSWNRLIEFVGEMQEQLRRTELTTDVTAAMDGYRSERLSGLLMQIPFGVLLVLEDSTILFANRAVSGMLGLPGEPLEGRAASQILDESLWVRLLSSAKSARPGQWSSGRWTDHTVQRPDNVVTLRFWSGRADSGGNEYILFVQDVTQAKEAERARDRFLYHITHELRTPLTNIRAYAETLSQGVIEDEQTVRECYNVIMGETSRLNRLVEDMLNISQLEVGTAKLVTREVQMGDLLRKVVQDNQGSADAANIDLVLRLPAKLPTVLGDRERLAVLFNNLIGNAIKYTPGGGRVEIRCSAGAQRLEVTVSDTGIGIEAKDSEKVFDKFYRVEDERVSKVPGTGLGLAIAKETVRVHGGTLSLESTPGKGTTFTVLLGAQTVDEADAPTEASGSSGKEQG